VEPFSSFGDIYSIVLLGIIGGTVALLIIGAAISGPFLARYWYKARRAEMELSLKQTMVERGMTAQQICAVMEAGTPPKPENARPADLHKDLKDMAHEWMGWPRRGKWWRARA
jgi:hypothetical protein